ncbi:BMP family lipoprotein [Maledivibacter halophilus]|uniref:Basic membrane protein A n=1 Tax=Maledivibacter halophilus TaxID=36842 RepID=A0A1T5LL58_9FIRM|nr:BMP family ABC transporter substrate-binding protein [Maledivibacter halophilus]SKC76624.1 basic membrane protein A [Maledivibacter halophilus]
MKKSLVFISFLLVGLLTFSGCASEKKNSENTTGKETMKAALITATGGLGDRSFNDSAHEGFKRAKEELGVEIKVIEPQSTADYLQSLKLAANADYDLIMVVGNDWDDALNTVVPNYPDKKFAAVNVKSEADNLAVAQFADHEGSFVVGALASLMSESGTVGFIGGMDVPGINRFAVGFEEGAKYANPDIKVIPTYVGSFADPSKGKEFAIQLIGEGSDIIFQAAGKSGEGLFEALKENDGVYGIGVDQDQDYIVEGKVLTSMIKNVGNAAYDFIKQAKEGTFTSGVKVYGLAEEGVGMSEMKYTKDIIPADVLEKVEAIRQEVIDGKVKVTDVFDK